MSSATTFTPAPARRTLSFAGILGSEALKLVSIPSTRWAYAVMAAITIGITAQISASTSFAWLESGLSDLGMQAAGVNAVSISTDLNVLVVSIVGVLVIAGEYSTGMIRSTFTAVPRRVPVLVAKFLVFAVLTTLVGAGAVVVAIPISVSLLAGNDISVRLDDPDYWLAAIGSVGYLVAIGLIAFGIAAILRNLVGAVATTVGVVLVAPIALGFVGGLLESQEWLRNLTMLLPFNLGRALTTHPGYSDFASPGAPPPVSTGVWALEPWHGALGLSVWVAVLLATAIVVVRRRDV